MKWPGPMKRLVNRNQMEGFAITLERAKADLSADEFNNLHREFQAEDASGKFWTVGIHTRSWHRLDQGRWVSDTPPEGLFLNEKTFATLQSLMPAGPATSGQPVAQATTCQRCGAQLLPGKNSCTSCGTPISASPPIAAAQQPCPRCGRQVPADKNFCTGCGSRL
jgi:ribosomal protein L37E